MIDSNDQSLAETRVTYPFSFTGTGIDYFFICIRTFLLAIITLGIYDAWGTVERRRYILGHSKVVGHGFDYHAKPKTILIGRLIAVGILVVIQAVTFLYPEATGIGTLILLALIPWLIVKALRFRTRNTSYRTVCFNFIGSVWGAAKVFMLLPFFPILIVIGIGFLAVFLSKIGLGGTPFVIIVSIIILTTLFLWAPIVTRARRNYLLNHLRFGISSFSIRFPLKPLVKVIIKLLFVTIAICIGLGLIGYYLYTLFPIESFSKEEIIRIDAELNSLGWITFLIPLLIYGIFKLIFLAYSLVVYNLSLNHLTLAGGHRFKGELRFMPLFLIITSNIIMIIGSLGLLYPFAVVRFQRYQLSVTSLITAVSLDGFLEHDQAAGGAAAAEFGAIEGVGDGIGDGIFG